MSAKDIQTKRNNTWWKYPHRSLQPLFEFETGRKIQGFIYFDLYDDVELLRVDGCHLDSDYVGGWGKYADMEEEF